MNKHDTVIVGGGLVGALLAILLRQRGLEVSIYEMRQDLRRLSISAGRSINLVATARGLRALELAGLREEVVAGAVAVRGRITHAVDGVLGRDSYGRDESEVNLSVSRGELNKTLLTRAEQAGVQIHFGHRLRSMDLEHSVLEFETEESKERVQVQARHIIGADGSASAVRSELGKLLGHQDSLIDLGHGYKELLIPPAADGSFRIEKNWLHIWPRGHFMMMALPNNDGTFTVTLYLPWTGEPGFEALDTEDRLRQLFEQAFPDAIPLIPDLVKDYFANPTGRLGTVQCSPWHHKDQVLLIGDAAHAIVPFFGQGMNCGFEDCRILLELLEANAGDWRGTFADYSRARMKNCDAIARMSLENFVEMQDRVGDPAFILRRAVEHRLEKELPTEYRSRYSMVAYSHIPYHLAYAAGQIQARILDQCCAEITGAEELDLALARSLLERELKPFLLSSGLCLDFEMA